jgi:hypothetical protein
MQTKLVEYAYPSSETATKAGYGNTGCWLVSIYATESACSKSKAVYFSKDKQAAIDHANTLVIDYNWMYYYLKAKNLN